MMPKLKGRLVTYLDFRGAKAGTRLSLVSGCFDWDMDGNRDVTTGALRQMLLFEGAL